MPTTRSCLDRGRGRGYATESGGGRDRRPDWCADAPPLVYRRSPVPSPPLVGVFVGREGQRPPTARRVRDAPEGHEVPRKADAADTSPRPPESPTTGASTLRSTRLDDGFSARLSAGGSNGPRPPTVHGRGTTCSSPSAWGLLTNFVSYRAALPALYPMAVRALRDSLDRSRASTRARRASIN